jgi:DNA replication protein DnaC
MSPIDELIPLLKKMRLSGVLQSLELRLNQATEDDLSHAEFLLRLLTDEIERRDVKQLEQRIRRADFEHGKTLESFDFHFNPKAPKTKIVDLATCTFIAQKRNVLFVGPTGVGKSHLAQAIGHRACRAGYTVLNLVAQDLFRQLRAARADASVDRRLQRLAKPDLLIVDDLGLRPLTGEEQLDLYELIRARHERCSTIITSNRAVTELHALFTDPLVAAAAMDRLLQNAHVITIEGDSHRNPPPRRGSRKRRDGQHEQEVAR